MEYNLFLDDNFTPEQVANMNNISPANKLKYRKLEWVIVRSYDEFLLIINQLGLPEIVSFDHDLNEEHWNFIFNDENFTKPDDEIIIDYNQFKTKTGYHAAKWLVRYCEVNRIELPTCLIHSQNKVGAKNLVDVLYR